MLLLRWRQLALIAVVLVISTTGCGEAGLDVSSLTPLQREGYELIDEKGCAACHGAAGQGGLGPALSGLAGSEVELVGGSTAMADSAYLRRAIVEPTADLVAGYNISMPKTDLTIAEVDALVAFIEATSP